MTKFALGVIASAMNTLGLNYSFMRWTSKPAYPYFVGEYQEIEPMYETGQQDTAFTLTGWTRGSWLELENAKEKIVDHFSRVSGQVAMAEDGSAVVIMCNGSLVVPTEDAELKRIQINLEVKEWSVKV